MNVKYSDPATSKVTARLLARAILRRFVWQGKLMPAFWTVMSVMSFFVNIILVVVLISLGQQIFTLKQALSDQLLTGLYDNFKLMDEAVIHRTIVVDDTIPVQFDLPVSTHTQVTLTEPTQINGAQVNIAAGVLNINAPANIVLPAGTRLPVALDIRVPVDKTVPVHLEVEVEIPLNETGLHAPFEGLQNVVNPYDEVLSNFPNSWEGTTLCQSGLGFLCEWFLLPK